ncbi:thrombospondin type 3 repeat-containing protein [Patescibacteria group bacterium]|nr:thrombospondin type 3 repeat-containing protein [Patescibacteria group bacterium]
MTPQPGENRLSREQKTGFVLLLVFAVLTVGLGFFQVRNNIYGPFVIKPVPAGERSSTLIDEQLRLQSIDTDQDGITDFQELEFIGTSPYLPDTDSDGIEDGVEIEAGTDPLCREGDDCSIDVVEQSAGDENRLLDNLLSNQTDSLTDILGSIGFGDSPTGTSTIDFSIVLNDPVLLRQLLLQTGNISESDLEAFSDDELIGVASEILNSESTNTTTTME